MSLDGGQIAACDDYRVMHCWSCVECFFFSSRRRHTRFDCDWSSDVCSSDLQCLTGSVPFDGEDSFSIGYKHLMEELPTPPLDTPDRRELFEIIRTMMAKSSDDRFQSAEDLVQVLEGAGGFAAVTLASAPTKAIPSLGGRLGAPPTTPLPR